MRQLSEVIKNITCDISGSTDVIVTGICYDSREVKPGNIFVCMDGVHTKGELFINDAVTRGAAVIIADKKVECPKSVTCVVVDNALKTLADISAEYYRHPSREMTLIGITGTNGKTTVSYIIEAILRQAGWPVSVIGTIQYRIGDTVITPKTTTPQSSDLQYMLRLSLDKGITTAIMEVSSHALALERVTHCDFDIGVFTNLTRDHLDFHESMEDYFQAKLKLFTMLSMPSVKKNSKTAVLNQDEEYASRIADAVQVPVIGYGLNRKLAISANSVKMNHRSMNFKIYRKSESLDIRTQLMGKYNIYNILAGYACAHALHIEPRIIKQGIQNVTAVPGRLERVDCGQSFVVLVDYAHTDDALYNVLSTLKDLDPKRLITVFGCGGDRDRSKRPLMGEHAVALSDYVFLTNDNPRSEDPQKIILDIEVGIRKKNKDNYEVILDRENAIKKAIYMAGKDDIILIAGKGHEDYQIVGGTRHPFDDRDVARKYIKALQK